MTPHVCICLITTNRFLSYFNVLLNLKNWHVDEDLIFSCCFINIKLSTRIKIMSHILNRFNNELKKKKKRKILNIYIFLMDFIGSNPHTLFVFFVFYTVSVSFWLTGFVAAAAAADVQNVDCSVSWLFFFFSFNFGGDKRQIAFADRLCLKKQLQHTHKTHTPFFKLSP